MGHWLPLVPPAPELELGYVLWTVVAVVAAAVTDVSTLLSGALPLLIPDPELV